MIFGKKIECPNCGGSGVCANCHGSGKYPDGTPCVNCNKIVRTGLTGKKGDGKCDACGGSGKVEG